MLLSALCCASSRPQGATVVNALQLLVTVPKLAPAIRCVANHLWEQKLADRGVCCAHPWAEPDEEDDDDAS